MIVKIVFAMLLFLQTAGCAYKFGPHQRQLPGNHQKIYIKMFENRTQEVGIEADMTNAFVQELSRSGVGTVTAEASADVTLEGEIHMVDYLGKTALLLETDRSLFTEYQTRVNIILRLVDNQKKEIWQGQFMGEKNYKAPQLTTYGLRTANPLYNQSARRQTIRAIAKDMANEAIARMTENF